MRRIIRDKKPKFQGPWLFEDGILCNYDGEFLGTIARDIEGNAIAAVPQLIQALARMLDCPFEVDKWKHEAEKAFAVAIGRSVYEDDWRQKLHEYLDQYRFCAQVRDEVDYELIREQIMEEFPPSEEKK